MSVKIIIGAQWGDEGKGKLVDFLSEDAHLVARYQGGANAGHTVYVAGKKYVLHLIPGGILRPGVKCVIGSGVVIDPDAFMEELTLIQNEGISTDGRLFVSDRAHIIFPYHKRLDQLSEDSLDTRKIGTTGKGIGPAYVDKYNRCGIRVADIFNETLLKQKLAETIEGKNRKLVGEFGDSPLDPDEVMAQAKKYAEVLRPYVCDTLVLIHETWKNGDNIILEGAQGCLLDVDFGSYPFVTSSNPTAGGAVIGSGLPPNAIDQIIGVIKAYTTRVGSGPFPTEKTDATGDALRRLGNEFGATTGRPRRCGWFDAVAARYSVRINGFTGLVLTKLDVLSEFSEIEVCTSYAHDGNMINDFPADISVLENCSINTEKLPGWQEPISECRAFSELPLNAQKYVQRVEELCSTPVKYISVGVERDQIIVR